MLELVVMVHTAVAAAAGRLPEWHLLLLLLLLLLLYLR
jgi:hypothetical protein